jgi:hypothetical protein
MLDHKQRHLIDAWMNLATQNDVSPYTQFMGLWIAFNAYCYAYYATEANRGRADIRNSRGLAQAAPEPVAITGSIRETHNRVTIDIESPGPIKITVAPKYTEDLIFAVFARQHVETYARLLTDEKFRTSIAVLQQALQKRDGEHYVINMARIAQHSPDGDLQGMASQNIIVRFNDARELRDLKDVLYQIRCNVFHGEKIPGDLNDDRIVNAATPVLRELLIALLEIDLSANKPGQ